MNEIKLSKRLSTVASYIPIGSSIADIGSDHAYLPCFCILNEIAVKAIAGEVVSGPYMSAKKQVEKCNLENKIKVKLANGLFAIEDEVVDCITISGMGGPLIVEILENGKDKLHTVHRLILQPNVGGHAVRRWLFENGWKISYEDILEEDSKIYEIIVADKGLDLENYSKNFDRKIYFGPHLIREQNEAFKKKWTSELTSLNVALNSISKANSSSETESKTKEILQKIRMIEEVLNNENT
ncbi:MAG: hypothetical protein K0S34_1373 [Bacillales bacterium]|jgi:tRNA (adenine22-N1)-methyltransferase|nr:hypothetical protein [Bacillales bacterium]